MKLILSFLFLALIVLSCQSQNPIETTANNQTELYKGGPWSLLYVAPQGLYWFNTPVDIDFSYSGDVASFQLKFHLMRDMLTENSSDNKVYITVVRTTTAEEHVFSKVYELTVPFIYYDFIETINNPSTGGTYTITVNLQYGFQDVCDTWIYRRALTLR